MKRYTMERYRMQLIFGLPILAFAIAAMLWTEIDRAFLGGIIGGFTTYFFRKSPPKEE